jgi:hypothetical protein
MTYGAARFRSEGMQSRRAAAADAREQKKRAKGNEQGNTGDVALAAIRMQKITEYSILNCWQDKSQTPHQASRVTE